MATLSRGWSTNKNVVFWLSIVLSSCLVPKSFNEMEQSFDLDTKMKQLSSHSFKRVKLNVKAGLSVLTWHWNNKNLFLRVVGEQIVMSHIGWEENKPPFIRVWKPSPSTLVLKPWGEVRKESPKRTISVNGEPGSLQMVSEPDTRRCVSLLALPWRGVDTRRCASKDAGPQGRWNWVLSHIDWRKERVSARTLGPEGGWIVMSHIGWRGEQPPSPSRRVLKSWGEARKRKPKEDNIC